MQHNVVRAVVMSAAIVGTAAVALAQDNGCEVKDVKGAYTYTETGTIVSPLGTLTTAAVGRYTFNADGTFTAIQWASTSGQPIGYDTKDGTYVVNNNCTVTMTINGYRNGVEFRHSVWQVLLADNGKEMRGISTFLEALGPNGWVTLQPVMTMSGTLVRDRAEQ
jgi:VCBS repeat-containing protein